MKNPTLKAFEILIQIPQKFKFWNVFFGFFFPRREN